VVEANEILGTAHLADVSDFGRVVSSEIQSQWPGAQFSGRAFTVSTPPGDNASLHRALEMLTDGDVLVVDGCGDRSRALWGAIMSKAALGLGVRGIVVDGMIRDKGEIKELSFPAFALGANPSTPYNKVQGRIGGQIVVGGVEVNHGDTVVGDDDGVIVMPKESKEDIFARARTRHALEAEIVAGLDRGEPLSSLLQILHRGSK